MKTMYVNIYGGPGVGKSTLASGIFYKLKSHGVSVEYVTEYAKDKVWADHHNVLDDQLYIFAKQHRKQLILDGKVKIVVTDSPLLFSIVYADISDAFKQLVIERNDSFFNLNLFLPRTVPYNPDGRIQTEDEAKQVDTKVKEVLDNYVNRYFILQHLGNQLQLSLDIIDRTYTEQQFFDGRFLF